MKASDLRLKNVDELKTELLELNKEQFNLRMQKATGRLSQPHRMGDVRKSIARVKTVLGEKAGQ